MVPSGNLLHSYILNMTIEIVDLPIEKLKIVIFHSYVSLPEGTHSPLIAWSY